MELRVRVYRPSTLPMRLRVVLSSYPFTRAPAYIGPCEEPGQWLAVAFDGNVPVGFHMAALKGHPLRWASDGTYVLRRYRRRGLASRMWRAMRRATGAHVMYGTAATSDGVNFLRAIEGRRVRWSPSITLTRAAENLVKRKRSKAA